MPRWKGKKVTNAHYFGLKRAMEERIMNERSKYGWNYTRLAFEVGGNKNLASILARTKLEDRKRY